MIKDLRQYEEVFLYDNILQISMEEEKEVISFLRVEYANEAEEYPYVAPVFNENTALWGAKTVYIASQLLLYRKNKGQDLPTLLPDWHGEIDAATILSADLCLRFVPDIVLHLQMIDPEDALLPLLKNLLQKWHYSGIASELNIENLTFEPIFANPCLNQLYVNRVIEYQRLPLLNLPVLQDQLKASLSIYSKELLIK